MVDSLTSYLAYDSSVNMLNKRELSQLLWLDIFAINQHVGDQMTDDLANLHQVCV